MAFDFNKYLRENKLGPYSKTGQSKKERLNELGYVDLKPIGEAPIPPKPENVYSSEQSEEDFDNQMSGAPWHDETFNYMDGQGGREIYDNIKYLSDNGFELEDIFAFVTMCMEMVTQGVEPDVHQSEPFQDEF